jgi:hypothetical protein
MSILAWSEVAEPMLTMRAGARARQRLGQHERGEVVDREHQLMPFGGGAAALGEQAGVVDEQGEARVRRDNPLGGGARFGEQRKIRLHHLGRGARHLLGDPGPRRVAPPGVSRDEHRVQPGGGEAARDPSPDPRRRSGEDRDSRLRHTRISLLGKALHSGAASSTLRVARTRWRAGHGAASVHRAEA